jgi:glycosyltransferase involved in cell wall biosynthesis
MKKKILIIYPNYFIGGSTTSLISLLNKIDKTEFDIHLAVKDSAKQFNPLIPKEIIIIDNLSKLSRISFINKIFFFITYLFKGYMIHSFLVELIYKKKIGFNRQILSKYSAIESKKIPTKYDVAIGYFEYWANDYLITKVDSVLKISWIHTDYIKAGFVKELDYKKFMLSNYIVSVSMDCKNNFDKAFPEFTSKSLFIENIIQSKQIKLKSCEKINNFLYDSKDFKILTLSRIDIYTKGLDRIIITLSKLIHRGLSIKWYVIGGGPEKLKFQKMINNSKLTNNLILLGSINNPFPYFKYFDLFILPSRFEGKPISVTEALILELPVVVTNYTSAADQVINQFNGIIIDNDEEMVNDLLYKEIINLYHNPDEIVKMRLNLKNFDGNNENEISKLYKIMNNN